MKKSWVGLAVFLMPVFFFSQQALAGFTLLPPALQSEAYRQYVHHPKSEFSKLLYLKDRFWPTDYKVIYDGQEFCVKLALLGASTYIAKNYRNEDAESWIRNNAYRTLSGRKIIQLKYPDGKIRPLRDVLLEELSVLQNLGSVTAAT